MFVKVLHFFIIYLYIIYQNSDIFDVECTFNDGNLCEWKNAPNADFNWEVKSGPSGQINAGPTDGHTGR